MTQVVDQPGVSDRVVEHAHIYEDDRVRISLAAALVLTLAGSIATAIYLRRQARSNVQKLASFAVRAGGRSPISHSNEMARDVLVGFALGVGTANTLARRATTHNQQHQHRRG